MIALAGGQLHLLDPDERPNGVPYAEPEENQIFQRQRVEQQWPGRKQLGWEMWASFWRAAMQISYENKVVRIRHTDRFSRPPDPVHR